MDRPATVTTALIGVVLIAVSLPFLIDADGPATTYRITWTEVPLAAADAPFAGQGQTATVPLTTPSALASNITVTMTCADTPGVPARPATVSWTLKEGARTLDSGSMACANDDEVARINLTAQPDVGSVKAGSQSSAQEKAYEAGENATRSFVLEFSYTRPASQLPGGLPVGQATIAGRMGLEAESWQATANEADEEATR